MKSHRTWLARGALAVVVVLVFGGSALAQGGGAQIEGVAKDEQGASCQE